MKSRQTRPLVNLWEPSLTRGWLTGIEPAASAATEQRSAIELQPPYYLLNISN